MMDTVDLLCLEHGASGTDVVPIDQCWRCLAREDSRRTGAQGGRAGRGAAKRRSLEHYREMARRSALARRRRPAE
jgi:hypothetical protein